MSVRWLHSRDNRKREVIKCVADVTTALFSGLVVWGFASWLGVPDKPGAALAGLAGYGGVKTIDLLSGVLVKVVQRRAGDRKSVV